MITDNEFYYWETSSAHQNNDETMSDFLDNHMPESYEVIYIDGTYAEIRDGNHLCWEVHASGDGDFTHHKVQFVPMEVRCVEVGNYERD